MGRKPINPPIGAEEGGDFGGDFGGEYSLATAEEPETLETVRLSDAIVEGMDDDDIEMSVYRRMRGKKTAFLFELEEYDNMNALLVMLRDQYGGGDFVIEGRRSNGTYKFKRGITVEKVKEKPPPEAPAAAGGFENVLLAMQQNAQEAANANRELMVQMQQQQMAAAQQNMSMLVEMLKANKPEPPPPPMSAMDIVALMESVKSLNSAPDVDPMDHFLNGLKMGKEMGDTGSNDNILQTAIKTLGPPIAEATGALGRMSKVPTSPTPTQPVGGNQNENQLNLPIDKVGDEEMSRDVLIGKLKTLLGICHGAAVVKADPETYANLLLDQLGESMARQYIFDDAAYGKLFLFAPQLDEHREWFDELRAIIIDFLQAPDPTPVTDVPEKSDNPGPFLVQEPENQPD